VTGRKHSEKALRESERRFSLAFHANPIPVSISEIETGRILDVNEQFLRTLGYSREEVIGKSSLELGLWANRSDRDRLGKRILQEGGAAQDQEVQIRTRSGEIRNVVGSAVRIDVGSMPCVLSTFQDITPLRQSEQRYRLLFERNLAGVFRSTLDGVLLDCNEAFARIYGFASREEVLARPAADLYPVAEFRKELVERVRREKALVNCEEQGRRKDGSSCWILGNYTLVPDSSGKETIIEGTLIDITERKRLEEQFRQAQKMEAVGQLAGGVAHDFNNLLTSILGYSDLLADRLRGKSPEFEALDEIRKAGERAASLTRQLLAFSRQQVFQPKVLDVNTLMHDLHKMLGRLIGEDIELVTEFDSSVDRIRADASQIEQVIMNLAVNARDAMPQGGTLTFETRNVEIDEAYVRQHAGAQRGRYVMIAVSDTGHGMNAATQARIFEPFFTTKELGKGTGLGLATVYGIVKQSGGYIWVYSEPARGTTFQIYLPRVEEPLEDLHARAPAEPGIRGTETLLLVEDEGSVRTLSRTILESRGYTVLEASGPREALETARRHEGPIHLVVTDVVMPEMSGWDLAAELSSLRPGVRVLYMSGYPDRAVVRHGFLAEGSVFLQKPFSPDVLGRKVREALS